MKLSSPIGVLGEQIAAAYLQKQGYKILETNYSKRYGEIDIIAIDPTDGSGQAVLAFVEVKTRISSAYGTPFEAITHGKLQSLIKTAQFYAMSHPKLPQDLRIDAVSVKLSPQKEVEEIELLKNISGF